MSESAAAVRRSRCSRTDVLELGRSRRRRRERCASAPARLRATASGGAYRPRWRACDVLNRSNRPMAVPHSTHLAPLRNETAPTVGVAPRPRHEMPSSPPPCVARNTAGCGQSGVRPWPCTDLRESADHVRDPCPAPRPRPAHLRGAAARQAAAPPRRPHPRRAPGGRGRPGPPGLPGRAALDPLLRAARRPARGDDRPAQGGARRPRRRPAPDPAHPGAQPHRRPRRHRQAGLAAVRRRPGRVGADALPEPGHRLHLQPGRLRHELPVLRHRPGGAHPQHVDRRDRRAGRVRRPPPAPR